MEDEPELLSRTPLPENLDFSPEGAGYEEEEPEEKEEQNQAELRQNMYTNLKDLLISRRVLKALRSLPREHFVRPLTPCDIVYGPGPIGETQAPYIEGWLAESIVLTLAKKCACSFADDERPPECSKTSLKPDILLIGFRTSTSMAALLKAVFPNCQLTLLESSSSDLPPVPATFSKLEWNTIVTDPYSWPDTKDVELYEEHEVRFDAILVRGSVSYVPQAWKTALRVPGLLIVPTGKDKRQSMLKIKRKNVSTFHEKIIFPSSFRAL